MDYISHLKLWMHDNFYKLITDKTEVLLGGPKSLLSKSSHLSVSIDGVHARPAAVVRNLGVPVT